MKPLLWGVSAAAIMFAPTAHAQTDDEILEAVNAVSFYVVAANACRDENGGSERLEAALTASESLLVYAGAPPEQAKQVVGKMIEPPAAGQAVRQKLAQTRLRPPIRPLPESG